MGKSRAIALLLGGLLAGCGEPAAPLEGSPPNSAVNEEETGTSIQPMQRPLVLGTHALGEDHPDAFISVQPGDGIPIVYGPQGAYMVILALELEAWASSTVTVSVSAILNGLVVASLYYPDLAISNSLGQGYAANLFVVTNGWEEYVDRELSIEVFVESENEFGEVNQPVTFQEPAPMYGL